MFALFFGAWILRAVYQSLVKPTKRPPRPAQPAGPPAKGLREFLEEIRQGDAPGRKPAAGAAPAERAAELEWDPVEEVEEVIVERPEPPRPVRPAAPQPARAGERRGSLADRHLDSTLDEREIGSHLDEPQLDSALADRKIGGPTNLKPSTVRKAAKMRRRSLTGVLQGLTVRELFLAEVILGKPRSKRRRVRDV